MNIKVTNVMKLCGIHNLGSRLLLLLSLIVLAAVTAMVQSRLSRLLWLARTDELDPVPPSSLTAPKQVERCAMNFYGLPRAFESLVLPSIVQNVIVPNAPYQCDYFVHYYEQTHEPAGRTGAGGTINPEQVLLLQKEVEKRAPNSVVLYARDPEEAFWKQYDTLIQKIRNDKDDTGHYLYYPWKDITSRYPTTTDNIIKMWHSIQQAWQLMERYGNQHGIEYTRVAMMRLDVVYVTPIDIFQIQHGQNDTDNKFAVVPGFARYPVNDRLVYGPARAVRVWATQRFDRLEAHVQYMLKNDPGWGMHSENFIKFALLPAMRNEGVEIVEHNTMCFFRARVDERVWISDCGSKLGRNNRNVVERVLGRNCTNVTRLQLPYADALHCPRKA